MGAVGALQNIKTPSKVAQRVMQDTDHMMLVGAGALKFAKAEGFKEEDIFTDEARAAWLMWKRALRDANGHSNWGPGVDAPPEARKTAVIREVQRRFPQIGEETLAELWDYAIHPPHGTINCIALNEKGEMSAVTTTSGMAWKRRAVARSGHRGGGLDRTRRRESSRVRRASDCGEHAPRIAA
jgi:N4-(beta-N-acetylglucosaminyl)-L-asparaginase